MPEEIRRTIKLVTQSHVLKDVAAHAEGFPMRRWSIKLVALGTGGQEVPLSFVDRVVYRLHPTFQNPNRTFKKPPFRIEESGWGEFDLTVVLHYVDKGGEASLTHDLHFQEPRYEVTHQLKFTNPKPGLVRALAESGAVDEAKTAKRKHEGDDKAKKKSRSEWTGKPAEMERLAEGLQKLDEDDLVQVVKMVTEHQTDDMYVKNDVEEGELHLDLYTLGDPLLKMLWEFTRRKVDV